MPFNKCDFCGGEFRSPDTISRYRNDQGAFIKIPGEPYLPFKCPHCKGIFCINHRLPENHNCANFFIAFERGGSRGFITTRNDDVKKTEIKAESKHAFRKDRITPYLKGIIALSLLILGIYYIITTPILSNLYPYIQSSSVIISSTLSTTIESISKTLTPTPVSTYDIEKLIFKYTNDERRKNGLKDLVWDDKLAIIAREHSQDMAKNNFFSHTNLSGEDPSLRAIRHGYTIRKPLGGGAYTIGIGENISKMPTGNVNGYGYIGNDADSVAKAIVKSWMESSGHRANILNSSYDKLGVGVAYDGTYYVATQNFF